MAGKNERGFAAMDPEQQREIARRGGRAAHESGNAHEFTSQEASEAGRKGGEAVSKNREHMAEIGRKGGLAAHHRNAAFHHESAAHHHRQAARHHEAGNANEGDRHSREAHTHSDTAREHSQNSLCDTAAIDEGQQETANPGDSDTARIRDNEDDDDHAREFGSPDTQTKIGRKKSQIGQNNLSI
jgi:general stress protein YciG